MSNITFDNLKVGTYYSFTYQSEKDETWFQSGVYEKSEPFEGDIWYYFSGIPIDQEGVNPGSFVDHGELPEDYALPTLEEVADDTLKRLKQDREDRRETWDGDGN